MRFGHFRVWIRGLARRRWHTALLALILCLTLVGTGGLFYYHGLYRNLNSSVHRDDGYYFPEETVPEYTQQEEGLQAVDGPGQEALLRAWAREGKPLEDRNILNILLCGVDSSTGDARGGRSDAMILVSLNKRGRTVTLTSFLRDCCCYIDLNRDPNHPRTLLGRMADAYSLGGPATLMETLTAEYKIRIDDYVCVDFDSFPKLINTLGGVTLDVSQAEAAYINSAVPSMGGKFPQGPGAALTGEQALVYGRIVGDSEQARTERQQRLILAILDSARQSPPGQIVKAISEVLQHVRTDLTEDEVDTLAKDALMQGWLSYEVTQLRVPDLRVKDSGAAQLDGLRVLIVDYPQEAKRLQKAIYGYTNIK